MSAERKDIHPSILQKFGESFHGFYVNFLNEKLKEDPDGFSKFKSEFDALFKDDIDALNSQGLETDTLLGNVAILPEEKAQKLEEAYEKMKAKVAAIAEKNNASNLNYAPDGNKLVEGLRKVLEDINHFQRVKNNIEKGISEEIEKILKDNPKADLIGKIEKIEKAKDKIIRKARREIPETEDNKLAEKLHTTIEDIYDRQIDQVIERYLVEVLKIEEILGDNKTRDLDKADILQKRYVKVKQQFMILPPFFRQ